MRATVPLPDEAILAAQVEASYGIERVRAINPDFAQATPDLVTAVIREAVRFGSNLLGPLNDSMDAEGARLADGRVMTAPGHREVWREYVAAGWTTFDQPTAEGGQGLPRSLTVAVQEVFDRFNPAFGMLPVAQRSAARLINAFAEPNLRAAWLPDLVAGGCAATICISEPEAGSDLSRIRSIAEPLPDGSWSLTGEKCWISYGDHDLSERIVHCVLARTSDALPGAGGLSLFIVPSVLDQGARNAIHVRRLEHKMGLHGSPTCSIGFEGATAWLLGDLGRGLAQMFVMITNMRLSVAAAGLGLAGACSDTAMAYARDRRQGGPVGSDTPIIRHRDVQRQLMTDAAQVTVFRSLLLSVANLADIAQFSDDIEEAAEANLLSQWLLPIVKTTGGQLGFDGASGAMQVLGGAGYTREWPVEQALRDARVLTIFEGTTGIQALDLVHRRLLKGDARSLQIFLRKAREAGHDLAEAERSQLSSCLEELERVSQSLIARGTERRFVDSASTAYLHLASAAALAWAAARILRHPESSGQSWLAGAARYCLAGLPSRSALLASQCLEIDDAIEAWLGESDRPWT